MNRIVLSIFTAFLWLTSMTAVAESSSIPMPQDSRLIQFAFDANNTYTILTMPGAVTDIEFDKGEKLIAFAVGDNVQWIFAKTEGHVFVKPVSENIFTSATLVTDQRTYQITLRASPKGGRWYQRVNWVYPDILLMKKELAEEQTKAAAEAAQRASAEAKVALAVNEATIVNRAPSNPVKKYVDNPAAGLNFDYTVKGNAEFKPTRVYDNGHFVWLVINPKSGIEPAMFVKNDTDAYDLITTIHDGDAIKTDRIFRTAILKVGKQEVEITNNRYDPTNSKKSSTEGGFWPWQKTN